jgi:hypothetical protein
VIGKARLEDEVLKSHDRHGQDIDIGIRVTIIAAQFRVHQSQIPGTKFVKEIEVENCSIHGSQANPAEVIIRSTTRTSGDEAEAHQEIILNAKDLEGQPVEVQFEERTPRLRFGLHNVSDLHIDIDQTHRVIKRQQNVPQIIKRIIAPQTSRKNVAILLYLAVTDLHHGHGNHPPGAVQTIESEAGVLNRILVKERQAGRDHHIPILPKRADGGVILRNLEDGHPKVIATHRLSGHEIHHYLDVLEVRALRPQSANRVLDYFVTNIGRIHRRPLRAQREHSKRRAQTALKSICLQEVTLDKLAITTQTSKCKRPFH